MHWPADWLGISAVIIGAFAISSLFSSLSDIRRQQRMALTQQDKVLGLLQSICDRQDKALERLEWISSYVYDLRPPA